MSTPDHTTTPTTITTPRQRAWRRFKQHKLGYYSFLILCALFVLSLFAEVLSNDKPLLASYNGTLYTPIIKNHPETTFGGDFDAPTDFLDPYIQEQLGKDGNWALYPPNTYSANTINYFAKEPNPAPPSADNWLGTDDRGRDMLAQLLYGFRVSFLFGFVLTAIGTVLGILIGAIQGYFGGKVDLVGQRFVEMWGTVPQLYLLIIFSAIFAPSLSLLIILLSAFSWIGLSEYVRVEFLRNKQLEYVRAAKAMGLSNTQIMWRHLLPNSLTPVITFIPFNMSGAIVSLTALDFLGLGVPDGTPSLGKLLNQGKTNLDAWWIVLATFIVLVTTLLLLTFIGDALRDAIDPRLAAKAEDEEKGGTA